MSYVIETKIPCPGTSKGPVPSEERKTMQTMEVGQSFLVTEFKIYERIRGIQSRIEGRKFSLRKHPGGWRLWRVE